MSGTFTRAPHSTVLTDANGYVLDSTNPIPVNPAESGAAHFGYNQVTVSSSVATQIVGTNSTRRAVVIVNNDSSIAIYVGDASVTTSTGLKLAPGAALSAPLIGAIYAKAASGSPVASYLEAYD